MSLQDIQAKKKIFQTAKNRAFTPLEIIGAKKKRKENKSLTGFTLIEVMVAIMLFSILIEVIVGLFISGVREQRRSLGSQVILDQTSYALEYMSRSLRLAAKQSAGDPPCLAAGSNYEITQGGLGVKFRNHLQNNDCQEFFLQDGQLKYRRMIGRPQEGTSNLTSNKLEITSLKLNLVGETQADDFQPELTLYLSIKERGTSESPGIKIQTTLSQRNLDVSY